MNILDLVLIGLAAIFVLIVCGLVYRRIPKRLKTDSFTREWRELQALCKDKAAWPEAIARADALLDKALKRRKFKGKSMGERMVTAQRKFTNNDDLWFAHNLHKKLLADPAMKLKDIDVKDALVGFRQALMDVGAFKKAEKSDAETEDKK